MNQPDEEVTDRSPRNTYASLDTVSSRTSDVVYTYAGSPTEPHPSAYALEVPVIEGGGNPSDMTLIDNAMYVLSIVICSTDTAPNATVDKSRQIRASCRSTVLQYGQMDPERTITLWLHCVIPLTMYYMDDNLIGDYTVDNILDDNALVSSQQI